LTSKIRDCAQASRIGGKSAILRASTRDLATLQVGRFFALSGQGFTLSKNNDGASPGLAARRPPPFRIDIITQLVAQHKRYFCGNLALQEIAWHSNVIG
jgi:hypothetical protein